MESKIRQAIQILCEGRTFFSGYFDDFENLSRTDKAIYILTKALNEGNSESEVKSE